MTGNEEQLPVVHFLRKKGCPEPFEAVQYVPFLNDEFFQRQPLEFLNPSHAWNEIIRLGIMPTEHPALSFGRGNPLHIVVDAADGNVLHEGAEIGLMYLWQDVLAGSKGKIAPYDPTNIHC